MFLQPSDGLFFELLNIFEESLSLLLTIRLRFNEQFAIRRGCKLGHEEGLERISKESLLSLLAVVVHDSSYY